MVNCMRAERPGCCVLCHMAVMRSGENDRRSKRRGRYTASIESAMPGPPRCRRFHMQRGLARVLSLFAEPTDEDACRVDRRLSPQGQRPRLFRLSLADTFPSWPRRELSTRQRPQHAVRSARARRSTTNRLALGHDRAPPGRGRHSLPRSSADWLWALESEVAARNRIAERYSLTIGKCHRE